jgi:3-hydroxymyristoyl/3-hydroxydecanoyl-(acyl carrier protein) dehydratase
MLSNELVRKILPQKGQMVMVDSLIQFMTGSSKTDLKIERKNIYFQNNIFCSAGLIENMAQTFLLGQYLEAERSEKKALYLLAAINSLKIISSPKEGDRIETETTLIKSAMGINRVLGKVYIGTELCAEATFTVTELLEE